MGALLRHVDQQGILADQSAVHHHRDILLDKKKKGKLLLGAMLGKHQSQAVRACCAAFGISVHVLTAAQNECTYMAHCKHDNTGTGSLSLANLS